MIIYRSNEGRPAPKPKPAPVCPAPTPWRIPGPKPALVDAEGTGRAAIVGAVLQVSGIARGDLLSKSRRAELVRVRWIIMALSRDLLRVTWQEAAEAAGRSDHTTAIWGVERCEQEALRCPKFASLYRRCETIARERLSDG